MDTVDRQQHLLRCMAQPDGATLAELWESLPVPCSERTLRNDLQSLCLQFPHRLNKSQQGRALRYHFTGQPPRSLRHPLQFLDEDQITALIAARGILRLSTASSPNHEQPSQAYHGILAQAIDRLLTATGLAEEASRLSPDDLCVSRFGIAEEEPAVFPAVLDVLRRGDSVTALYPDHQTGELRQIHARPIRMVSIAGEWFVFVWAPDAQTPPGRIKQYRLSRLSQVTRATRDPPGCPVSGLRAQVTGILAEAFRATGSASPKDRHRVRIAGGPEVLKFVERRRWGSDQHLDLGPHADLPQGWWRLDFVTSGVPECRHWLLGFGRAIRVESPPELVAWLQQEAQAVADLHGSKQVGNPDCRTTR